MRKLIISLTAAAIAAIAATAAPAFAQLPDPLSRLRACHGL